MLADGLWFSVDPLQDPAVDAGMAQTHEPLRIDQLEQPEPAIEPLACARYLEGDQASERLGRRGEEIFAAEPLAVLSRQIYAPTI